MTNGGQLLKRCDVAVHLQWLVFDTQMIFGGRSQELSAEEYISGALALYIDVCSLFLIILGFSSFIN